MLIPPSLNLHVFAGYAFIVCCRQNPILWRKKHVLKYWEKGGIPRFFFTAETHCYPVKSAYVPLLKPSSWSNPPFFPSNPHILGESQLPPRFRRCQVSAQALPPIRNDSIRAARHPWRQWWEAGFCLSRAISWKCGDMMGYNEQISSE